MSSGIDLLQGWLLIEASDPAYGWGVSCHGDVTTLKSRSIIQTYLGYSLLSPQSASLWPWQEADWLCEQLYYWRSISTHPSLWHMTDPSGVLLLFLTPLLGHCKATLKDVKGEQHNKCLWPVLLHDSMWTLRKQSCMKDTKRIYNLKILEKLSSKTR